MQENSSYDNLDPEEGKEQDSLLGPSLAESLSDWEGETACRDISLNCRISGMVAGGSGIAT